jgi:hypothetical protein
MTSFVYTTIFILTLVILPVAQAQTESEESNWKVGGFGGPFLPSNYPGVTEIMKTFGARASYFDGGFGYEVWGFRSAEDGAVINYLGGSLVKGMQLPEITDVIVLITGGLHGAYSRRAPADGVTYEFARQRGIHMGGGILMPAFGNWSFRGGTTIFNGPGRTVLVELGLQYNFGGVKKEEKEEPKP